MFHWFIHFAGMNAVKVQRTRIRLCYAQARIRSPSVALRPRHAVVHVPDLKSGAVKLDGRSYWLSGEFPYHCLRFRASGAVNKIPRNLHRVDIADGDCICGHCSTLAAADRFLGQILQCTSALLYPQHQLF